MVSFIKFSTIYTFCLQANNITRKRKRVRTKKEKKEKPRHDKENKKSKKKARTLATGRAKN
jgi:hypothetical protein